MLPLSSVVDSVPVLLAVMLTVKHEAYGYESFYMPYVSCSPLRFYYGSIFSH